MTASIDPGPAQFNDVDGVVYANAHNDGLAIMLYERAGTALHCPAGGQIRLDHPAIRSLLLDAMDRNSLSF